MMAVILTRHLDGYLTMIIDLINRHKQVSLNGILVCSYALSLNYALPNIRIPKTSWADEVDEDGKQRNIFITPPVIFFCRTTQK